MLTNPRVMELERTFAVRAATCRGMLAAYCQEAPGLTGLWRLTHHVTQNIRHQIPIA